MKQQTTSPELLAGAGDRLDAVARIIDGRAFRKGPLWGWRATRREDAWAKARQVLEVLERPRHG